LDELVAVMVSFGVLEILDKISVKVDEGLFRFHGGSSTTCWR